jgi:AcrR family transcriptional regulator
MGIKERQERDREAVRRAILDAARDLFVSDGYQNVSIRKIAERIEYSPAAIYGYFEGKDDIFFALAEEGFRLLGRPNDDADALDTLTPLDRIRAIFWRLYEFSRDHQEYFALMFVDRTVPRIMREYQRFAFVRETKAQVIQQMQACIDAGEFPRSVHPMVAFRLLMMGLLGVATLRMSDRLAPGENADALARDVIEVTLAGLRSGVPLTALPGHLECPAEPHEGEPESKSKLVSPDEASGVEVRR